MSPRGVAHEAFRPVPVAPHEATVAPAPAREQLPLANAVVRDGELVGSAEPACLHTADKDTRRSSTHVLRISNSRACRL